MSKNSKITRPDFKSEKEEADWYHTPEGRVYMSQSFKKAAREGRLRIRNGASTRPATKADLEQLIALAEQARAAVLQPVNLRLPQGDLEAAKRLAEKTGKGYQTILKEIIHEGLKHAS